MTPPVLAYKNYAKINLYLDILERRNDGYTNIETIFQTVGLCDTLRFEPRESGVSCACTMPGVPVDEENLAVKAARLLQRETGTTLGAHIAITKAIPVAGGMAGGSGNAAATLAALNELWALGLSMETLEALALRLGSDVPYCLRGGTVAATGRGEEFQSLPALPETWLVLLLPGIPISAGSLYNHPQLERSLEGRLGGVTPAFSRALRACAEGDFARVVFNRFETPAFIDHPELLVAKERLIEAGCIAAAMSGSGSTLFGLCESRHQAEALARGDLGFPALAVATTPTGIERCASSGAAES